MALNKEFNNYVNLNSNILNISAFTLAEVLITLGIIGIVAALTIPALMQNTQNKELKVAWKKAFSELSQVQDQLNQQYSGDYYGECETYDNVCLKNLFAGKMKVAKNCDKAIDENCEVKKISFLNNTLPGNGDIANENLPSIITVSGYSVQFRFHRKDCDESTSLPCGWMLVDVNGLKKPNEVGKDVFFITIQKNRLMPFTSGSTQESFNLNTTQEEIDQDCLHGTGVACSSKYLYE